MAKTPEIDLRDNFGKNYIINGDMRIAQRGTSFPAIANNTYHLDRWNYQKVGAMVHTITQDTDVPTLAESGQLFFNSLRLNLTTPDTSIAAGDYCFFQQRIEGYNWADLAQRQFTVTFWVKATLTGTYTVAAVSGGIDRSIVKEYTISSANTWEKKTITFAASPSAGTWNYANGIGLYLSFTLAVGSTFQTTPNSWTTGNLFGTSSQVNGVNTGATDFRITGVQVNVGTEALPFRLFGNDFDGEVRACQRYYEKTYNINVAPGTITSEGQLSNTASFQGDNYFTWNFKVSKRALPGLAVYNPVTGTIHNLRNLTEAENYPAQLLQNGMNSTQFREVDGSGESANSWIGLAHATVDAEL